MSSTKLIVIIMLSLVWTANMAYAGWQAYSQPVNGATYGTSDGISAVTWNNSTFIVSADYRAGVYYSTDEGETWILGDAINGKNATFIIADPYNVDQVYIARDAQGQEGFWFSRNRGADFEIRNEGLENTSITSIYIDPNGSHPIYVTCAAEPGDLSKRIFKTTDLGESWNRVFPDMEYRALDSGNNHRGELDITCMFIQEGVPEKIWVGTFAPNNSYDWLTTGVWASRDFGNTWSQEMGGDDDYYKQELWWLPGGGTICRIFGAKKIVPNPLDADNPYCYVETYYQLEGHAWPPNQNLSILKRTSDDYPNFTWNWELQGNGANSGTHMFKSLDIVEDDQNIPYSVLALSQAWKRVITVPPDWDTVIDTILAGVYIFQADDPDPEWIPRNTGLYLTCATGLDTDPADFKKLYCGTKSRTGAYGGQYKSVDWAASWYEVTEEMHTAASLDLEYFVDTLWAGGTQPGAGASANMLTVKIPGENWSNRFAIGTNSFRDFVTTGSGQYVAVAVRGPGFGEDSIYVSEDWGQSFRPEYGYYDVNYEVASVYGMARKGLNLYATLNHGTKIVRRGFIPTEELWDPFDDGWPTGIGSEAMAIDASQLGNTLYAGSRSLGIFKLIDTPNPTWTYNGLDDQYHDVEDIAVIEIFSKITADSVLVACKEGKEPNYEFRLLRTLDGGVTWNYSDCGIAHRDIRGMETHPDHKSVVLATSIEGVDIPHVYLSIDGGARWDDFSEGLDPYILTSIKDIEFGDLNPAPYRRDLYVGTNYGIFENSLKVVSQNITSNTTWHSGEKIFITQDITVTSGAALTIEPGVEVYLAPNYDASEGGSYPNLCEIIVDGALLAGDLGGSVVTFKPWSACGGYWQGIAGRGEINLSNCVIESASDAVVGLEGSAVILDGCSILNGGTGVTCVYPSVADIHGTAFLNNKIYAVQINNSEADVSLVSLNVSGEFVDGIRYFGYSRISSFPLIDDVNISKAPTYEGIGIYLADDEATSEQPMGLISNTRVEGFEHGIYLANTLQGTFIGPEVRSDRNNFGILLDNANVEINGSTGLNVLEENVNSGLFSSYSAGKVRYSHFIGGQVVINIDRDGDLIDFGFAELEEEWGNNTIIEGAGGSEMLLYVRECNIEYPAQMNWWGVDDPQYIDQMTSDCVLWEPYWTQPPPTPKLISENPIIPTSLTLAGAYPNPFNIHTTIRFSLPEASMTSVKIYNVLGQEICELYNEYTEPGEKSVIWDGRNKSGEVVATGTYLYAVRTETEFKAEKMLLLK